MSHIFISYSKKDIDFARHLRKLLQDHGFAVWMDETKLVPSQRWWPTIETNIRSCAAFVIIMSPSAAESDWVERELLGAEKYRKPIFPVLLSGEVWLRLGNVQYQDMTAGIGAKLAPVFIETLEKVVLVTNMPSSSSYSLLKRITPSTQIGWIAVAIMVLIFGGVLSSGIFSPTATPMLSATAKIRRTETAVQVELDSESTKTALVPTSTPMKETLSARTKERILFGSQQEGRFEIYVMDSDGSNLVNLTRNAADDYDPNWSPDGSHIAFISRRDGNQEVYVMDSDGSNPVNLTRNAADDYDPNWSPDGSHIAFISRRDGNQEVYVMDSDGSNPVNLTRNAANDYDPNWSPDGSHIMFGSARDMNFEIYVMNDDGSDPINVTNNTADDFSAEWSPDGSRITFTSRRDGNFEIYVMNANGSRPVNLTNSTAKDDYPNWSPDGSRILFTSWREGYAKLTVVDANGSNPKKLITFTNDEQFALDRQIKFPQWSPDGTQITFILAQSSSYELYIINANGTNLVNLMNIRPADSAPKWQPMIKP
jgi:Tol biopolymer transport system component